MARRESPGGQPDGEGLNRGLRRVFWVVTLSLPLLFFALLEGGLRLGGYGASYPLFTEVADLPGYRVHSRDVAHRYFHRHAEAPTAAYDVFRSERAEGGLRLFVQGGSSAAGFPYYHGGAFSRMLRARLQHSLPGTEVEVVNTAMAAVNSYTLLDLAPEIIAQRPDAVLIYAGHNEYYGAFGVGSTESIGGGRWLVNSYLRLRGLRTMQLLGDGLGRVAALGARPPHQADASLMARMVGEQEIAFRSPAFERGKRQFEGNLRDLLKTYRRASIPVFVATLAFNERDHPPFTTVLASSTDPEAWWALYERAETARQNGASGFARDLFTELVRMDSTAAAGHFGLAKLLEAEGDLDGARRAYRRASDLDALRFRAPTIFNEILARAAAEQGARVVDVEGHLRRAAPEEIIGGDHMLEHLHPNVDGYFLMADAFYEALWESGILDRYDGRYVDAAVARGLVRITPADSLVAAIRIERLMGGWPFREVGTRPPPAEDLVPSDTPEGRAALDLYYGRATWLEATEDLAAALERDGRLAEAVRTREAMVQGYPMLSEPQFGLASQLMRTGETDRAAQHFRAAIALGERTGRAHGLLGAIELQRALATPTEGASAPDREQLERARALLEQARRFSPRSPQTLFNLSGAYAHLGRVDDARTTLDALLRLQPEHAGARQLLASLSRDEE